MKNHPACLLLVVACVMFVAGGCVKNESVKKDVPITVSAPSNRVKTEAVTSHPPNKQSVASSSIKDDTDRDALEPIPNAGELKAAPEEIYFDFDSYALSKDARYILTKNAEIMKRDYSLTVRIEGHCDERGSDEYNLALGEKRARAAEEYLVMLGVPPKRLSVISYGREKPVSIGHDEASWASNRRDEFVITK